MSDLSNLKFPSGRCVGQVKKDAKRLKKSQGITLTEAQNQCACDNGISLPWDQAIEELKRRALFASLLQEQIAFDQLYMPSEEFIDLMNRNVIYPPKHSQPSLTIDLSLLPSHVYETLLCHPLYIRFIERFMQFTDFDLKVKHPHRMARYKGDNWRFEITFDGYSGEGDKSCNDVWAEFRSWVLQFGSTQRIHISERIDNPSYSRLATQTHWEWTPLDAVNELELDVDRAFYCQMIDDGFDFASIIWHHCNFTELERAKESFDSHQATARFEYTLDGKTDTISSQTQGEISEYNAQIRTMQLYISALNTVMRHHGLTATNIPMKLLNIEMGKELFFGVTQIRSS